MEALTGRKALQEVPLPTHTHTLFLASDNLFVQKDNMEEMFPGSPKGSLRLSVIPMSLDWMWHYEGGSTVTSGLLRGIYHFIFIFQ